MKRTRRWDSLSLAALGLAGFGVIFQSGMLLSFAAIPITFVAYGALVREPSLDVDLERTVTPERPMPGASVTVELTVTNTGDRTVSDLRVIDGVPADLGVTEGSPRAGLFLRPGGNETIEYTVTARRGDHAFEPVTLISYTASGTAVRREQHDVESTLECRRPVEELPLGEQSSMLIGALPTGEGGTGVEFHSLRKYRSSDPRNRIDWRRFAKTDDLMTVEYREDRTASIHLLVDVRPEAFRAAADSEPSAVEYSTYAAELCFRSLRAENHRVGFGYYPDDVSAVSLDGDRLPEASFRSLFEDHPSLRPPRPSQYSRHQGPSLGGEDGATMELPTFDVTPDEAADDTLGGLRGDLPSYAQLIVFTPLIDDAVGRLVTSIRAYGHRVMVVSPDVTNRESAGGQLQGHQRQVRIRSLRERNVAVIDWDPAEPLSAVLGRAL